MCDYFILTYSVGRLFGNFNLLQSRLVHITIIHTYNTVTTISIASIRFIYLIPIYNTLPMKYRYYLIFIYDAIIVGGSTVYHRDVLPNFEGCVRVHSNIEVLKTEIGLFFFWGTSQETTPSTPKYACRSRASDEYALAQDIRTLFRSIAYKYYHYY